jgi:hypothetical protein
MVGRENWRMGDENCRHFLRNIQDAARPGGAAGGGEAARAGGLFFRAAFAIFVSMRTTS